MCSFFTYYSIDECKNKFNGILNDKELSYNGFKGKLNGTDIILSKHKPVYAYRYRSSRTFYGKFISLENGTMIQGKFSFPLFYRVFIVLFFTMFFAIMFCTPVWEMTSRSSFTMLQTLFLLLPVTFTASLLLYIVINKHMLLSSDKIVLDLIKDKLNLRNNI